VSVCDLVGNPYRRDTCREGNHCFLGTACPHIENVYRRDACYLDAVKSAKGSIDLCDKVVASKTKCLVEAAKNHSEVCERVGASPSSISRTSCYDVAFTHLHQSSACSGIENPAPLRECETRLALQAKDSAICIAMRTSEGADTCWNTLAQSDGFSCLKIQRPYLQHDCLRRYWGNANNARICSSLTPVALVQACRAHFRSNAGRQAQ